MRELSLELTGYKSNDNIIVRADGNQVKLEKDATGKLFCNYQTENQEVNIEVFKLLNVGGFFWFITQIFFFLITFFGLFGMHYKEKCLVIDFEVVVELKEKNKVCLQINNLTENSKAVEIKTDLVVKEKSNVAFVDTDAKKIVKALKFFKFLLFIGIIVIVAIKI